MSEEEERIERSDALMTIKEEFSFFNIQIPMKSCITCGMPFEGNHANDIGFETGDGPVCIFDSKDGQIKSAEEIFDGGVQFFASSVADGDRGFAERITRKNMKSLPYWKHRPFTGLDGPEATDQEFRAAMTKLMTKS